MQEVELVAGTGEGFQIMLPLQEVPNLSDTLMTGNIDVIRMSVDPHLVRASGLPWDSLGPVWDLVLTRVASRDTQTSTPALGLQDCQGIKVS